MSPIFSTPTGRKSIFRTVVGIIAACVIVFIILLAYALWYSSSHTTAGEAVSSSGSAFGGLPMMATDNVATKVAVPSTGMMYQTTPEIAPSPMPPIYDGSGATADERAAVGPKIIRTGNLNLRVDDAAKRIEEAKALANQFGGFIDSSNLVDNGGVKTGYVTIRVPSDKYDQLVTAAKKMAALVLSESSNAEDVTAQYVDLSARLTSAQAEEAQYLDILKQAKTVEDTLKVTQALSQVRTTIEQLQGQLRYLTDRTDYSTLTISLTEETKIQAPTKLWKPLETFRQAFQGLIVTLQGFVDFLIGLAIYGIGFILPVVVLIWLGYRFVRWVIGKMYRKK